MTMTFQDVQDVNDALLSVIIHSLRMKQLAEQEFEKFGKDMSIDFGLLSDRFEHLNESMGVLRRQFQKQRNEEIKNDERRKD